MPDLSNASSKIKRAKDHIDDLYRAKQRFLALDPYKLTPEFYPEHGSTLYFLDKCDPAPPDVGLLIGDAAHNLRTALDYLANTLFREANPGQSASHIYFPICKSEDAYKAESPRKTKGIPKGFVDAIDVLKPYSGGNDGLWGLHQLDISDKHHLLATTAMIVDQVGFPVDASTINAAFHGLITVPKDAFIPGHTVSFPAPRTEIALEQGKALYAIAGNFEGHKHVQFTFDVAFAEPPVFKGKAIIETLFHLSDLVKGIIDCF